MSCLHARCSCLVVVQLHHALPESLQAKFLNMHHILPPPSGPCWSSVWCNCYADLAICFVPLWRFMFFVIYGGKKYIISVTSKGIHSKGINLKRWISFESFKGPLHLTVQPDVKSEILHSRLDETQPWTFCLSALACRGKKKERMAPEAFHQWKRTLCFHFHWLW